MPSGYRKWASGAFGSGAWELNAWTSEFRGIPDCISAFEVTSLNVSLTGSLVDQLADLSGNGYHVSASGTERPTYVLSEEDKLPIIRFDGINDGLENITGVSYAQPNTRISRWAIQDSIAAGNPVDGSDAAKPPKERPCHTNRSAPASCHF